MRRALTAEHPKIADAVARAVVNTDRANVRQLTKIPGINPTKIVGGENVVRGFRDRAVSLIVTLEQRYLKDLGDLLEDPQVSGLHVGDMAAKIQERFNVTESRARFWARDQTLKLNAEITRTRMTNAGIARYVWTTSQDDRVRGDPEGLYPNAEPSHAAREGQIFSFDDPPEGGPPGEDYNCRCVCFPVLDDSDEPAPEES